MKFIIYPLLRLYRRIIFGIRRSQVAEYNNVELASKIAEEDLKLWGSGESIRCLLTSKYLYSDLYPPELFPITILDFGGGGGRHGFQIARSGMAKWMVVETPALVDAASKLLAATGITFVKDIAAARALEENIGIVHVSSALQYTADPFEVLNEILSLGATYLIFEKMVLTSRPRSVQFSQYSLLRDNLPNFSNGVGSWLEAARYPLTALPLAEFIALIQSKYEILEKFEDPVQSHLPWCKGLNQYAFVAKHRKA